MVNISEKFQQNFSKISEKFLFKFLFNDFSMLAEKFAFSEILIYHNFAEMFRNENVE